jgi:hypothetical protein
MVRIVVENTKKIFCSVMNELFKIDQILKSQVIF